MPFFLLNLPSYLLRNRQYPGNPGGHIGSSMPVDSTEVSPYCNSFDLEVRKGLRLLSLAFFTFEVGFNPGKIGFTATLFDFGSEINVPLELTVLEHTEHLDEAAVVVLNYFYKHMFNEYLGYLRNFVCLL